MSRLASLAESDKLMAVLPLPDHLLSRLQELPPGELRRLRLAINERQFDHRRPMLQLIAALANRLPARLVAWLAQRQLGPLLSARIVGFMSASRVVRVAGCLPAAFLAEVAINLDPRFARDILRQLPPAVIVPVALCLVKKRAYTTLGRFVDVLEDETLRAVIDRIEDEGELLRIAYYVESQNHLDHVIRLMPRDRLVRAILLVLEPERGLLLPIMAIIVHVGYGLQQELAELAAQQEESVLNEIVRACQQRGLWSDLLPVLGALSADSQAKVVNLPILRDDETVLPAILQAAEQERLWRFVLPLVPLMQEPMQQAVARFASDLGDAALAQAGEAALMSERWEGLLTVIGRLPRADQRRAATVLLEFGELDPPLLARLDQRLQAQGLPPVRQLAQG